jgi:hypothetical protein
MAQQQRNTPELPTEAYQLSEMYRLGQPLKLYRANFTNGLGCVLAILGFVVALVPLGGFLYEDFTFTPTLLQVTAYSVVVFLLIAFILLLPGFLTRNVRVYICTNGLVYIYRKASNTRVVYWEQIAEVEGPPRTTSLSGRRPSLLWISLDLLFGPGTWMTSRRGIRSSAMHFYCVLHLKDGSRITFSQAITKLPGLEDDIRAHLRRLRGR